MRVLRRMGCPRESHSSGGPVSSSIKKGTWTPEEDAMLLAFVGEHGAASWNMARFYYPELRRTGKSCRLRYLNQLRPGIRRQSVSPQEECFILLAHTVLGNQWSKIASLLQGRTDNTVKNVVNMRLKKARRRAASLSFARAAAQMLCPLNVVSAGMGLGQGYSSPATGIPSSSSPADRSGTISAEEMQMLAAISSLYPPDASAAYGEGSMCSNNWVALHEQGQLPFVQTSQGLSVGSELPSVQYYCNSLAGSSRAHKLPSVKQQSTSFDSDMSEVAASFGSFNIKAAAAATGDKDLLEAVYASGTAADSRGRGVIGCQAASSSASMMAGLTEPHESMECSFSYETLQAALFDDTGIMELMMRSDDLGSVIGSSAWDTMPGAREVEDPAFG